MGKKLSPLENLREGINDTLTFYKHIEISKDLVYRCLVEALNRIEELERKLDEQNKI